ncbi:MAG: CoA-binding protein, partial [Alphaproteobacteria bacterium]
MLTDKRRRNLERALNPRSVCYIGGSFLENTLRSNRAMGFDGDVWVVNPKLDMLADHPCFDTIDDLPGAPDAVFVAVNREMTNDLIPGLRDMGAGGAICYAAGYSEVGGIGHDLEADLKDAAGDLAVVGPNCYGVINYLHGVPLLAM